MIEILSDESFQAYYRTGFVPTGLRLPCELVEEIRLHYRSEVTRRNDFPKFFRGNEHQAFLEGRLIGALMTSLPRLGGRMVKRLYERTYQSAFYADQIFVERVCRVLLDLGLGSFFRTRYLVVGYDIVLSNDHARRGAGIHTDFPTFHHFYETENDITIYIPLTDLDEENGGRLRVLPESKLKVGGNMLLKEMERYFGSDPRWLDSDRHIVPERITDRDQAAFVKSERYQRIIAYYRNLIALANRSFSSEFVHTTESAGRVLLWNNKNFHSVEPWRQPALDRMVYIIRLFPVYDIRIRLKERLHGKPFNTHLIDTVTGELVVQNRAVDLQSIPPENRLPL